MGIFGNSEFLVSFEYIFFICEYNAKETIATDSSDTMNHLKSLRILKLPLELCKLKKIVMGKITEGKRLFICGKVKGKKNWGC